MGYVVGNGSDCGIGRELGTLPFLVSLLAPSSLAPLGAGGLGPGPKPTSGSVEWRLKPVCSESWPTHLSQVQFRAKASGEKPRAPCTAPSFRGTFLETPEWFLYPPCTHSGTVGFPLSPNFLCPQWSLKIGFSQGARRNQERGKVEHATLHLHSPQLALPGFREQGPVGTPCLGLDLKFQKDQMPCQGSNWQSWSPQSLLEWLLEVGESPLLLHLYLSSSSFLLFVLGATPSDAQELLPALCLGVIYYSMLLRRPDSTEVCIRTICI